MAASDYLSISFKNRLHLAGRPQMSARPNPPTSTKGSNTFGTYCHGRRFAPNLGSSKGEENTFAINVFDGA